MKVNFLKKAVAFVTAVTMSLGMVTVMPEGVLPQIGFVVNAESSYESFSNIPCGEYATMSLSNGALTISGVSNMFEIALDNQLSGYSTYYDYRQNIGDYVKSITISNGVTSIGSYAFSGFSALSSVTIPDTVESINAYAFSECTSLSNITIPQNTELSIYDDTIFAAANSNLIIYGYSNSSAEKYATEYNIQFISLDNISSNKCGDNAYWELSADGTLTISGTGEMYLWTAPKEVPWYSYKTDIKRIIIEYGITNISQYAFYDCENLESVVLSDCITKIGYGSFKNCSNLTAISIPDSVTDLGNNIFEGCNKLSEVKLSNNITKISSYMFCYCTRLEKITIPDSVTEIQSSAFTNCFSLSEVNIPNNCTSIKGWAFSNTSISNISLPNGITWIDEGVFAYCSELKNVIIPETVTFIDMSSFTYCSSLEGITIPNGVTTISFDAFENCSNLKNILIPESVNTICGDAFKNCKSLISAEIYNKNITFGSSSDINGEYSPFHGCDNITLYGYMDSTTQELAEKYTIPFVALDSTTDFTSATITQNTNPIYIDDEFVFMVSVLDSEGNSIDIPENVTYSYSISNPNIIEITDEGYIGTAEIGINAKAIGAGTTTITVTFSNGVSTSASVTVESDENTTDYTQYLKFEFNDAALIKFDYENGVFNPSSKEIKYYYGATLIDTTENQYGNDVILSNVTIKLIAPTGFSFDESGKQTTFSKNFEKLRLNTDDCSGTVTLYPQSYTYPTVTLKAEVYVDNVLYDSFDTKVGVTQKNTNAIDISEEYDETDTDGDGLPDVWEKYGITYNGDFLDLPAMGADPNVPDIFVEVDYKEGCDIVSISDYIQIVCKQFKSHGYNLHVDMGPSSIDYVTGKKWGNLSSSNEISGEVIIDIYTDSDGKDNTPVNEWKKLIDTNFNNYEIRTVVFRHCIFGEKINNSAPNTNPNAVTHGFAAGIPHQYFFVAYNNLINEKYSNDIQKKYKVALTFMHELGHTLGLHHGGIDSRGKGDDTNEKPNYLSIMNYSFQNGGLQFYEQQIDEEGYEYYEMKNYLEKGLNYSEYDLPKIDENNINEFVGIDPFGKTDGTGIGSIINNRYSFSPVSKLEIDFNWNEVIEEKIKYNVNGDIDKNNKEIYSVLSETTNDWEHIIIKTTNIGCSGAALSEYINDFMTDSVTFDITYEEPEIVIDNHTHSYNSKWSNNSTSHWHECSCGEKKDIADHISDNGKVTVKPTATSSGTKTYSCTVCGYVIRTEILPATGGSGNTGGNGNTGIYVPPTTVPSYTPTFPTTIVTRPTLTVKATTKNDTVTLKWNKINNAKKYTVYQLVNGKYVKIKDTDKTSVTFKKLKSGKTYKFLVRYTVNGQKSSNAYSGRISVTVNYKPVVRATATQNSVKLVWDDVPNAQKYAVYKYVNGKAVKLIETKKTSVKINKLAPKTKYQYIVRAYINGKWTTMTKSDIVTATTK